MIIIPSQLFLLWAVQKHGYKSVPDSIAGLSESGANAEHTGKSCSRLEPWKHWFIRRIKFHMDFLFNASSSVSLNSPLFASTDSLHWTKIQEWNLITIESVLPGRPGMRAHAAKDGNPCFWLVVKLFTNLQNSFRRPWAPGNRGGKSRTCIQGFLAFLSVKAAFRPEYSRYTWQMGKESFHGVSWFPSPYIYIA